MKTTLDRCKKWFANYKVKIFSLFSALFLWFYVVTDNRFDHTISVPLHLINQPQGRILSEPIPSKVNVLFRGTGKDLLNLGYREKRIELDLHQIRRYKKFPITVDMIKGIPTGMEVIPQRIIEPDSVTVLLDQFAGKKVPLRPDIMLIPADGYTQVGDISLEPDSIIIYGPASWVKAISEVPTVAKEYKSVIRAIRDKISLVAPERETIAYSLDRVKFSVDVQRIGESLITEIPVNVTRVPSNIKVTVVPSTLSLKIQGGNNILSKLTRDDIEATIDFRRRFQYEGKSIAASIQVPEGITFSDVKPVKFEIILEK